MYVVNNYQAFLKIHGFALGLAIIPIFLYWVGTGLHLCETLFEISFLSGFIASLGVAIISGSRLQKLIVHITTLFHQLNTARN